MAPIWKDFMDGAIDNCEGNWRGQTGTLLDNSYPQKRLLTLESLQILLPSS